MKRSKKKIQRKGLIKADQRLSGEENLSYEQAKYVALRSICETDQEAIEKVGRSVQTLWNWRQKPEFAEIEQQYRDAPVMAGYMLLATLGIKAAVRFGDILDDSTDSRAVVTAGKAVWEQISKERDRRTPARREIVIVPSEVWERQIEHAKNDYRLVEGVPATSHPKNSRRDDGEDKSGEGGSRVGQGSPSGF